MYADAAVTQKAPDPYSGLVLHDLPDTPAWHRRPTHKSRRELSRRLRAEEVSFPSWGAGDRQAQAVPINGDRSL